MKRLFIICYVFFSASLLFAQSVAGEQQQKLDSLNNVLKHSEEYSLESALAYHELGSILFASNPDTIASTFGKSLTIADSLLKKGGLSGEKRKKVLTCKVDALHDYSYMYVLSGEYDILIKNFEQCLKIYKELKDTIKTASCLSNIGYAYQQKNDLLSALNYNKQSLSLREKIEDKQGEAISFTNIGMIYNDLGDTSMALNYFKKGLDLFDKLGHKEGLATANNNMGSVYHDKGDYQTALVYYFKALELQKERGDNDGILTAYNNIGASYTRQGDNYEEALEYYRKSLKIAEEIDSRYDIANAYNNIAFVLYDMERIEEAQEYINKCLDLSNKYDFKSEKMYCYELLSKIASKQEDYKKANDYFNKYTSLRDSLYSSELIGELARFEYEQMLKKDSVEFSNITLALQQQLQQEKRHSIVLWLGLIVLFFGGGVVFIRYKRTTRKKKELEQGIKEVELQRDEISQKVEDFNRNYGPIVLKTSGLQLEQNQIYYIEADKNYVRIYSNKSREPIAERSTLQEFGQNLPHQFVQIHRSFIINKNAIDRRMSKDLIRMKNGDELKVSRTFYGNL